MRWEYGHSPRGIIVEDVKRGQQYGGMNVSGALNKGRHLAIECYRQTADSDFFETWFKDNLFKEIPSGYTVIMDNTRFHRKEKQRKQARGKVRLLFLPPYSPDYNPIEKSWANMKRYIRNNLKDYASIDTAIYSFFIMKNINSKQYIVKRELLHGFFLKFLNDF